MKKFILIISLGFLGCHGPKKIVTGHYIVSKITEQGTGYTVVKFQGYKMDYNIPSDTLKVNDTIFMRVISLHVKRRK